MTWLHARRLKVILLVIGLFVIPYTLIGVVMFYNLPRQSTTGAIIFFSVCGALTTIVSCLYGFHFMSADGPNDEPRNSEKARLITAPPFIIDLQPPV